MNRILIADDSVDLLEILKITLSEEGYEVKSTINKREFLSSIKDFSPDIILLDVFLNEIDGRELCKQLKNNNRTKHIPIILFSANPYAIAAYKQFGANDCINKPFEIDLLLSKIGAQLNNRSYKQAS
ncbi:MAG: hypothetical protein NVS3B19_15800 [Ginsengibacter sp.]